MENSRTSSRLSTIALLLAIAVMWPQLAAAQKVADASEAAQTLLDGRDLEQSGGKLGRRHFQRTMLERILSLPIALADEDLEYLLEKLDLVSEFAELRSA